MHLLLSKNVTKTAVEISATLFFLTDRLKHVCINKIIFRTHPRQTLDIYMHINCRAFL